jgi:hypothetical protein
VCDALDGEVAPILEHRQDAGVDPWRGALQRARRPAPGELMRPLVVVLVG